MILRNIEHFKDDQSTMICIGTFDGVHKGHQKLLQETVSIAKKNNVKSVALTFNPHPKEIINPKVDWFYIDTLDEKIEKIINLELDYVIIHPFTKQFSKLSAEEFIVLLVKKLNCKYIIVGFDHHFGKDRNGNKILLETLAKKLNFKIFVIDKIETSNVKISSSTIRKLLNQGKVEKVIKYLGRPYLLSGQVVVGNKIGRTIGFPTANLMVETKKLLPASGAYAVICRLKKENYYGMVNIGTKPTLNENKTSVEVHIFDFNENIYGTFIQLEFLFHIRVEKKFANLNRLSQQLECDKNFVISKINN